MGEREKPFGADTEELMAKRRLRPTNADKKRMRQWRSCGVLSLAVFAAVVALYAAVRLFHGEPQLADHPHRLSAHGGVIVSVGDDKHGHYHVEAVVEKGGALKLYAFGGEADQVLEVEPQTLTAAVKCERGELALVDLMPVPQPGDAEGKTSQFIGKLPQALWGKRLGVSIPRVTIRGKQFALVFAISGPQEPDDDVLAEGENKLFLTSGGKYTAEDIKLNGGVTASQKYQGFKSSHDVKPMTGEKICPITRAKANPKCTWVVGGKSYEFCCPPCIDEFVRRAKEKPQTIREPETYVK